MSTYTSFHSQAVKALGRIKTNEYDTAFFFEKWTIGKEDEIRKWFEKYCSVSLILSVVYCAALFLGQRYMRSREACNLQKSLALWSGCLAVYSIMGSIRVLPEAYSIIRDYGLRNSLCHPCYFYDVPGFWAIVFTLSKAVELGDTFFIVARKQRLIFLHWYHHITVLVYCFFMYPEHSATGRWFYCMNYVVHSLMYSYYTLRALRVAMPRQVSILITSLQIIQMLIGNSIFVYFIYERLPFLLGWSDQEPPFCQLSNSNILYGFLMYFSYLVLFLNFFIKSYLSCGMRKDAGAKKDVKKID